MSTALSSTAALADSPAQPYAARCSIPLSAALAAFVSHVECSAAPNPFRCDFIALLWRVTDEVHPHGDDCEPLLLFGDDPRTFSYLTLTLYRLLRHLIPPTDAVAAAAGRSDSDAPPTPPASVDEASTAMECRIREVFIGALQAYAVSESNRRVRTVGRAPVLTADAFVQPLLSVDALVDERGLSAWQWWLVNSETWQWFAGATLEYVATELLQTLGDAMTRELDVLEATRQPDDGDGAKMEDDSEPNEDTLQHNRIVCLHGKVLAKDRELRSLWLTIGMPADYPPVVDIDLHTAYKQQFEQWMSAAVTASAPWMFDRRQVERRVGEWMAGRLPSGDSLFFRRYHIRPLWHSIMDGVKLRAPSGVPQLFFPMKAGFDLVDAAGVSRHIVVYCRMYEANGAFGVHVIEAARNTTLLRHCFHTSAQRTDLCFDRGELGAGDEEGRGIHTFDNYLCHGHLHGLSEQQWDDAMGGTLRVGYYSADAAESRQEHADDEQAAKSRENMFPARLEDVTDRWRYRSLQRAEIRRMAAIATRLATLDAGVDVAVFPCFQPAEMRRRFEAAAQSLVEMEMAGLPAPLPRVLQGIVMDYHTPHVDIPLSAFVTNDPIAPSTLRASFPS